MESPLSNREIMGMFKSHETLDEQRFGEIERRDNSQTEILKAIHTEVKATNGKVAELNKWKWMMAGGLSVITLLLIPIVAAYIQAGKL